MVNAYRRLRVSECKSGRPRYLNNSIYQLILAALCQSLPPLATAQLMAEGVIARDLAKSVNDTAKSWTAQ